ncbi:hypothetical protein DENSPDRAFT_883275 [Dentipellis sp. KUC8613]|nr:hypothetical protein DENSPDRAFT_883275 [Dentipellis sp. KUC8613]
MRQVLVGRHEFRAEDIVTMTDADPTLIGTELWPTRDNILVHQHLVDPLPRGCRLTAILDACHSGTLLDLDHYHCHFRNNRRHSHTNLSEMYYSPLQINRMPRRSSTLKPDTKLSIITAAVATAVNSYARFFKAALKAVIAMLRFRRRRSTTIVRGKNPFICGRKCQYAPHMGAIVISISSCMDHEVTWEDRQCEGAAMTVPLVEILTDVPTITTGALMRILTYASSTWGMDVQDIDGAFAQEYQRLKAEYRASKARLSKSDRLEKKSVLKDLEHLKDFKNQWQRPQVGAMRKLPDDEPFIITKPRRLLLPPLPP